MIVQHMIISCSCYLTLLFDGKCKILQIEKTRPTFEGMKLEEIALKPGKIHKYEPGREEMERVELKAARKVDKEIAFTGLQKPQWAVEKKLGNVESRFGFDVVEQSLSYLIKISTIRVDL